jgi:dTDP-4-amino-4,6-dideoxyglucose formyltransferase
MKIFLITDNKWWFKKAKQLFNHSKYDITFYCSPSSSEMFKYEIENSEIKMLKLKESFNFLCDSAFKLGISAHCKQIFPPSLVNTIRCINIHPGYNPYNRGWYPQVFSILNKKASGATIHIMDEEVDHGNILFQEEVKVLEWDTSKTLYDRILEKEFELFKNNFVEIIERKEEGSKMKSNGNYNSIKDFYDLCKIEMDKSLTVRETIDYLRAMTHPPYKNAYFLSDNGKKVFVEINFTVEN